MGGPVRRPRLAIMQQIRSKDDIFFFSLTFFFFFLYPTTIGHVYLIRVVCRYLSLSFVSPLIKSKELTMG